MAKKLWCATYEINVLVAAETEEEAKQTVWNHFYDIKSDIDAEHFDIALATELPGDWEDDSIPFGADGDKTVGEYFEEAHF
jgi:hypothetical protein